jgi:enediyne biosynthesis protein E4
MEFYYGSGYLSQSARKFVVPANVREIHIYDFGGKERSLQPTAYGVQPGRGN